MIAANRLSTVKEYYFSRKLREVAELIAEGKPVINLAIGSPDLAPPREVLEALNNAMRESGAHQYQPYRGIKELRCTISDFYNLKFGVDLNPETEILPLMGSKEGIMHISMAFLNPGNEVLLPNPGYPTYSAVTRLLNARERFYELDEQTHWLPDLEKLKQTNLSQVKLMWVNYPHMPTGATASDSFFRKLTNFAEEHEILVINDNPYSLIQNSAPKSILNKTNLSDYVLELNSLSKSFNMAGWRIGYVLGSQKNMEAILKVKSNMDSGMFYPLQAGAIQALSLAESWFEEQDKVYAKRRTLLTQMVNKLNCKITEDQTGLFIWAKIPEGISSEEFIEELLHRHHIFIAPGSIFGSKGEGYVRISLCAPDDLIREALNRIK